MGLHATSEHLLTFAAVCERWHVDRRTLEKIVETAPLPVVKLRPRVWRIPLSAIEAYEHAQQQSA